MIPQGLFTQIALIILSVGIIMTYIKPTFASISANQDTMNTYIVEREKIDQVNQKLNTLKQKASTLSVSDKERLLNYLPNEVDTIIVPRDLEFISREAGVVLKEITYEGMPELKEGDISTVGVLPVIPQPALFSVAIEGNYNQVKNFLDLLQQNHYPLQIQELSIQKKEGGFLSAEVLMATYQRKLPTDPEVVN